MRTAGVLMPLSSLPSKYGIGDMGSTGYAFVDLIKQSKSSIWQILPLNPVGFGNSPYQPYSSFAGDEIYIGLDQLFESGLLTEEPPLFNSEASKVYYDDVRKFKAKYLKLAYKNFLNNNFNETDEDYIKFSKREWVYNYAVFLTLKKKNKLISWNRWAQEEKDWIKDKKYSLEKEEAEIGYEIFIQYIFYKQWMQLKNYANNNGIKIMGDIPFYVGVDSLDVWSNQESFLLDKDGKPTFIAGVPPDFFSDKGQRWGNPIYNWERLRSDNYKFWIDRVQYNAELFDLIRIDHFRAFDTYWSIPSSCLTAQVGEWIEAPGYEVLEAILRSIGNTEIIAEDLGDLRPEVLELRDHFNLKGMLIAQFDTNFRDSAHDFKDKGNENFVIYTGTHDNQTTVGWYKDHGEEDKKFIKKKLEDLGYKQEHEYENFLQYTLDSDAKIAILPLQDILGIDDKGRINTPGTVGTPNWEWKLTNYQDTEKKMKVFEEMVRLSNRDHEYNN